MQYTLANDFLKQWPAIPWLMGAVVLGLLLHFLLFRIAQFLARRTESDGAARLSYVIAKDGELPRIPGKSGIIGA